MNKMVANERQKIHYDNHHHLPAQGDVPHVLLIFLIGPLNYIGYWTIIIFITIINIVTQCILYVVYNLVAMIATSILRFAHYSLFVFSRNFLEILKPTLQYFYEISNTSSFSLLHV